MRSFHLGWKERPPGLIDGAVLRPDILCELEERELYRFPLRCGNRTYELGEVFDFLPLRARGDGRRYIRVDGSETFLRLGAGLGEGRLEVHGPAGALAGAGMRGGEILVRGDAREFAGAGMRGGLLVIDGSAGNGLGGPLPGARCGMEGGEIVVGGSAGELAGHRQRRGLIAVAGSVGSHPGFQMLAGTLVAGRGNLVDPGIGMNRGTIIALEAEPSPPASFAEDGPTEPVFWRVLARRLLDLDFLLDEQAVDASFLAFSGDRLALGRGEILYRAGRRGRRET